MQSFLFFPMFLHKLPYHKYCIRRPSTCHDTHNTVAWHDTVAWPYIGNPVSNVDWPYIGNLRPEFCMAVHRTWILHGRTSVSSFAILSGRTRYAHARFSRRTLVDGSAGRCLEIGDTFDQLGLAAVWVSNFWKICKLVHTCSCMPCRLDCRALQSPNCRRRHLGKRSDQKWPWMTTHHRTLRAL